MILAYIEEPLKKPAIDFGLFRLILPSTDGKEREPIRLGSGSCKLCNCKGYEKGETDGYCGNCGHGWTQHR